MKKYEAEFGSRWGVLKLVFVFNPIFARTPEAEANWRRDCHTKHPSEWVLNGIKEIES